MKSYRLIMKAIVFGAFLVVSFASQAADEQPETGPFLPW